MIQKINNFDVLTKGIINKKLLSIYKSAAGKPAADYLSELIFVFYLDFSDSYMISVFSYKFIMFLNFFDLT